MRIIMFTNTYAPHVGGVARSIETLETMLRKQGHQVYVVAPKFPKAESSTEKVLRVPAIQNFNGSDFSVCYRMPSSIHEFVESIGPDVIHSHHPFLLGDAALRMAREREVPIVFTHHTMYEHYTHYVPMDSPALKRMAIQLATEYCDLCDAVIAPSSSIRGLLRKRGVRTPITSIATGVDLDAFARGDRGKFRQEHGIGEKTFVIGHVGRLAREKNLEFMRQALERVLAQDQDCGVVIVGDGAYRQEMEAELSSAEGGERVIWAGKLTGQALMDAYAAMDLFVMASQSETQGMVVAEAMAAGHPVVALDGPGIREVVKTGRNGDLLPGRASTEEFAQTVLRWVQKPTVPSSIRKGVRQTARRFAQERCAAKVAALYETLTKEQEKLTSRDLGEWDRLLGRVEVEWDLFVEKMSALRATVATTEATEAQLG